MLIELSFETSETSVITCRLIRPSVSTTGVKLSEMPNFLKEIDGAHCPIWPATVAVQVTPVGIGNSPPAMKVADSPEIAVRFGSASGRTTPSAQATLRAMESAGVGR